MAWQQFSIITDEETAPKIAAYLASSAQWRNVLRSIKE